MALGVASLRCGIWSAIGAYLTSSSNQSRIMGTALMLVRRVRSIISAAPLSSNASPTSRPSFARTVRRAMPRHLDEAVAGFVEHGGRQRHLVAPPTWRGRRSRVAMAVQHPEHLALGLGAAPRRGVLDLAKRRASSNPSRRIRPRTIALPTAAAFRELKSHGRYVTAIPTAPAPTAP